VTKHPDISTLFAVASMAATISQIHGRGKENPGVLPRVTTI
jgi:hypothetical protein